MNQNIAVLKATSFYKALQLLSALGYSPRPIKINDSAEKLTQQAQKRLLYKIAVAAFCAGNIMLLSSSIYFGLEGRLLKIFEILSFIFCIPVVTYCSTPFYLNLYRSIIVKRTSIDAPIVVAIFFGFMFSSWNLLIGSNHHYFDSISILVFLILMSRYALNRTHQSALKLSLIENFIQDKRLRKYDLHLKKWTWVSRNMIQPGDFVYVICGEKIPVDGLLYSEYASINPALLTGESLPKNILKNDLCYAGTTLLSDQALLKVNCIGEQTRIGQILKAVESQLHKKTKLSLKTDQWAQNFTYLILVLASVSFLYFLTQNTNIAIQRTLALVIISCPCTLAFISPLIQSLSLKLAAHKGFLVKSSTAFEKLDNIKNIVFDKTGTLTKANFIVKSTSRTITEFEKQIIFNLERTSDHPVARALVQYTGVQQLLPVKDLDESLGMGVKAHINKNKYEIKKIISNSHMIGFYKNHNLQFSIEVGDEVKENISSELNLLSKNYELHILSGDRHHIVDQLANQLNIPTAHVHSNLLPEQKSKIIKSLENVLMVGDGANDSLALAQSDVSVAVNAAVDSAIQACDIYLTKNIFQLNTLLKMSKSISNLVKLNLFLSFVYNFAMGMFALLGYIHPFFAAIVMPINTLLILLINLAIFYKWRNL